MSDPLVLTEYEDLRAEIDAADASFIETRLRGQILLRRSGKGDYLLNPRQFVGLVTLPSGRVLVCQPKVPARNLFTMIGAALDLPDLFPDVPVDLERVEQVIELIVDQFAGLVERRIDLSLYRAYVEMEENLGTVRGRIAIVEDLRCNYILRHRTYCRFAEYSWDVPENRVLRQVVRQLAGWGLSGRTRRRLLRLDLALDTVTPGNYRAADLDRWTYTRLNEDYRPLHRFCRLFLDGASLSDAAGGVAAPSFLLDMNRLFEAYVTRALQQHAPSGWFVRAQVSTSLDQAAEVMMRPDIVIRSAARISLVADCKYKRLDVGEHRHHDLYQLLAYCTALNVHRAMLIYPRHLADIDAQVAIRNANVTIHETSVDLAVPLDCMTLEATRLADAMLTFAVQP